MAEQRLRIPLTMEAIRSLRLKDIVYLDGEIITGSTGFHQLVAEQNILPPFDFEKRNVLLHTAPVINEDDGGYKVVGLTPTSSRKLEKYNGIVIQKLNLKAIIGKTTVGEETTKVMRNVGCIHLTSVGTPSALLSARTKKVVSSYFEEELGIAERIWVLEVENFGPFIVDVDLLGNNLFVQKEAETDQKMKELYRKYGIPQDFRYNMID